MQIPLPSLHLLMRDQIVANISPGMEHHFFRAKTDVKRVSVRYLEADGSSVQRLLNALSIVRAYSIGVCPQIYSRTQLKAHFISHFQ
jgi:hypothetical protein